MLANGTFAVVREPFLRFLYPPRWIPRLLSDLPFLAEMERTAVEVAIPTGIVVEALGSTVDSRRRVVNLFQITPVRKAENAYFLSLYAHWAFLISPENEQLYIREIKQ